MERIPRWYALLCGTPVVGLLAFLFLLFLIDNKPRSKSTYSAAPAHRRTSRCTYCDYTHNDDEACLGPQVPLVHERHILVPRPIVPGQSMFDKSAYTIEIQPAIYGSPRPEKELRWNPDRFNWS